MGNDVSDNIHIKQYSIYVCVVTLYLYATR